MIKSFLLIILFLVPLFSNGIYDVPIQEFRYSIIQENNFDRIIAQNSFYFSAPGSPELPVVTYNYLLPAGQKLTQVEVLSAEWEELPENYYIYPRQEEIALDKEHQFTEPDPEIYRSTNLYPQEIIAGSFSGILRGYHISQMAIVPFRYIPGARKLYLLKNLRIKIKTESCTMGMFPRRQTQLAKNMVDRFLSSIVVNKSAIDDLNKKPPFYIENNTEDLGVTELPSLLGAPVELLIITTDQQISSYNKFARYKKLMGYNTVVKTVSWVRQHYSGVDDAERIRNFIKEAMEKWGVVYVLLGGEVPDVPTRWVWMSPLYNPWPVHIVSDLYFSDLNDNWNYDGDEKFGEIEDALDLYPDVFVGRLPTDNNAEMLDYLSKIEEYQHPSANNIQNKALFFTSDFLESGDARQIAERLANHLPQWFVKNIINEVPLAQLNDSIHSGYGIITGIGHGDVNHIRVRNNPRENANNFFFDSLYNTDLYAMMFTITCLTNTYQSDCLSKHWLLNPSGGGIGYIGPTSSSEGLLHESFTTVLFDSLFIVPVAPVLAKSKIPYIPDAQWDNYFRLYQFSINLLGDPTLTLWDSLPLHYGTVTFTPDTVNVGIDTVTISLDPPILSSIVFYKESEIFKIDTLQGGSLTGEIKTESTGYLKYTIRDLPLADRAYRFVAYTDSIYVQPVLPYLVYVDFQVQDTMGNSNGVINPGEDIFLYLSLKNTGSATATSASARITCADSLLNMVVDTASYGDIAVGQIAKNLTPFHFDVPDIMPDEYSFNFEVAVNYSGIASTDSFQIIGLAPKLSHFTQKYDVSGDPISIAPYLINYGHESADSVHAVISPCSDSVVIIDSIVNFPAIEPDSIVNSGPDLFKLYLNYPGSRARYNYRVYDGAIELINMIITLKTPVAPESLWALGMNKKINLEWMPVSGAVGYRIYRSLQSAGPYTFMKNPMEKVCLFEDFDVVQNVSYYYYVVSVDSSMNHSVPSDTVCGRINPIYATGWPQPVYDYLFSSCNFGDIDPYYPGYEIVVCGKEGNIYAWHCDGSAVDSTGDSRILDISPAEVWTSPAIGDVNADGSLEIAFGVRRTLNNLYVIDFQGNPLANWPITVPGNIIGSPVFSDVDDDDSLEIFIWTLNADLYAFKHDGSGLYSPSGLLYNGPGIGFGTPSIGDLNNDGSLEIVCCGGGNSDSLYVWDKFGNYLQPFPIHIQSGGLRYSAVMGDILGDERLEIGFYADNTEGVYLVDADGTILWFKVLGNVADIEGSPVFADITGDSQPEIICGYQSGFVVLDSLGNILPGFPDLRHDAKLSIIIDVDGDYDMDMVVGSVDWNLYAYESNGIQAKGFPILFNNRVESCPAACDIDLDGNLELMLGAYGYKFYVFDLESNFTAWPKFRYDQYNTGTLGSGINPGIIAKSAETLSTKFDFQAYPNPFVKAINIKFQTNTNSQTSQTTLKIYDVTGRLVKNFPELSSAIGHQSSVKWSGDDDRGRSVAPGVYFIKIECDAKKLIEKVVKIR